MGFRVYTEVGVHSATGLHTETGLHRERGVHTQIWEYIDTGILTDHAQTEEYTERRV
jgi:hypothetical protein